MFRCMVLLCVCLIAICSTGCARQPASSSSASVSPPTSLVPLPSNTIPTTPSPGSKRVVGLIPTNTFPELIPILIDEPIHANQPFTVTVITYGSSSCITPDGATVAVADTIATITPYDVLPTEGACSADLAEHPRPVELTFSGAGQATIRVQGQDVQAQPTTFETTVSVLP